MKIGVYGGTFNPIHNGHVHLAREFIRRLGLDRALLIPTGAPPHKAAPELAPAEDRLAMCALAAAEITEAPVEVSRIEVDRAGKSYTAQTLAALRERYPEDELVLLMGEDMFLTVDQWFQAEKILSTATLAASPRSRDGLTRLLEKKAALERDFGARCVVEDIPFLDVSSTQARAAIDRGLPLSGLVPEAVAAYIQAHGLYRLTYEDLEREAKARLSEKRFYHSQQVAEAAEELAHRYGADPEKARKAGILHDIMKDAAPEEQLKILEESDIILTGVQQGQPKLWHALSGAAYARRHLGMEDEEILSAVRWHTSGRGGMSLLEKVLFVADYISADRDYPSVGQMRQAAQRSLEEAIVRGVAYTLWELTDQCFPVCPDSVDAYNEALAALDEETRARMRGHSREFID